MHDPPLGRYRHYKGGEYELLMLARHSEDHGMMAVYRSVSDPRLVWVRPLEMFCDEVAHQGLRVPRFLLLSAASG